MNNQDIIDSMNLEDFSSYPTIELESINEISTINNIVNDPNLPINVYVPEDYVRLYIRGREPIVGIYKIEKCLRYIGAINTEFQFNLSQSSPLSSRLSSPYAPNSPSLSPEYSVNSTPMLISPSISTISTPQSSIYTPPSTPINEEISDVMPVTPRSVGGKKKKSRKVKNKKKNLTRKGGSDKRLPLGITDENENELFVPVVKDKKGKLASREDANIFATIRSYGVPPIYSPKMKDFDTIAFQNRGKSKNNKTKKKSN